jgi:hypothetical protein
MRARPARLLPHEQWFADLCQRRQASPTRPFQLVLQNYGHEGVRLLCAASFTGFVGVPLIFVGVVLHALSLTYGSLVTPSRAILGVVVGIELLAVVRAVQAMFEGRAFRKGRPYARGS